MTNKQQREPKVSWTLNTPEPSNPKIQELLAKKQAQMALCPKSAVETLRRLRKTSDSLEQFGSIAKMLPPVSDAISGIQKIVEDTLLGPKAARGIQKTFDALKPKFPFVE